MPRLRLMTYNVRHCRGLDGRVDEARIAHVIAEHEPDVVALQELDVGRRRTGGVHQPGEIAAALRMESHFCAAFVVGDERYGHAILSRHPCELVASAGLPTVTARRRRPERRAALWVRIDHPEAPPLQVVGTHLGLLPDERLRQAHALLARDWLGHPDCVGPTVLLGDFNSGLRSRVVARIDRRLRLGRAAARRTVGRGTFPSFAPLLCLDHVFVSNDIEVLEHRVGGGRRAVVASDHRPVIADVTLSERPRPRRASTG